jgi:hypothetical protein
MSREEEEDVPDGPVQWRKPEPPKREVPAAQLREFERAFSKLEAQIRELTQEYESCKTQYDKLKRNAQEFATERRALERSRQSLTSDAEVLDARLNSEKSGRRSKKSDDLTKTEIFEIQSTTRLIKEITNKSSALSTQYSEEQKLWKTEQKRLVQLVQAAQEKNYVMKQSIEQFRSYLEERSSPRSESPAVSVAVNPDSKLSKILSPHAEKQGSRVQSPSIIRDSDSDSSTSEQASFGPDETLFSSPIRDRPEPKPVIMFVPQTDTPESRFHFDYWPSGESTSSPDGRELYFRNGDVLLNCKNGVMHTM